MKKNHEHVDELLEPEQEEIVGKLNVRQQLNQVANVYHGKIQQRSKYSVSMDSFLTNGIIIVGVLLVIVFVIAFLF